jgi:putative FmdB family regulatory protein
MPTYEYTCKACGENIEVFQSFSAKPLKKHEACGGDLQKVFHARGVVFKGSGWYAKDSKGTEKSNGSSKSDDKSKSGDKSKSDTKSKQEKAKPEKATAPSSSDSSSD